MEDHLSTDKFLKVISSLEEKRNHFSQKGHERGVKLVNELQYYLDKINNINVRAISGLNKIIELEIISSIIDLYYQSIVSSERYIEVYDLNKKINIENDFYELEKIYIKLMEYKKFNEYNEIEVFEAYPNELIGHGLDRINVKSTIKTLSFDQQKHQHTNIFKGNSFEVWQSMFDSFEIKESSRTDIRFMFEAMKGETLIHDSVSQINILNWISKTYNLNVDKLPFKNFKNDSKRMSIYKNAKAIYIK